MVEIAFLHDFFDHFVPSKTQEENYKIIVKSIIVEVIWSSPDCIFHRISVYTAEFDEKSWKSIHLLSKTNITECFGVLEAKQNVCGVSGTSQTASSNFSKSPTTGLPLLGLEVGISYCRGERWNTVFFVAPKTQFQFGGGMWRSRFGVSAHDVGLL